MTSSAITLLSVESPEQREAARSLIAEYLQWVAGVARSNYELSFDIEAMVQSDIEDRSKFYPPTGRFYLVQWGASYVGVGCLKRLAAGIGEIQRMYVQPHVRGVGAGRILVERLLRDARLLGYSKVRLESLKALTAAHSLYRSVGFTEIDPYSENSMKGYQAPEKLDAYRKSAVFMEIDLQGNRE
jgi:GNAT superfamily N-acetyltransferase